MLGEGEGIQRALMHPHVNAEVGEELENIEEAIEEKRAGLQKGINKCKLLVKV